MDELEGIIDGHWETTNVNGDSKTDENSTDNKNKTYVSMSDMLINNDNVPFEKILDHPDLLSEYKNYNPLLLT